MSNLIAKLKSAVSNVVLFAAAIVMAGIGFIFMGMLALFALVAVGIAMIASPFVPRPADLEAEAQPAEDDFVAEPNQKESMA